MKKLAFVAVALFLSACTQTDTQHVKPPIEEVVDESPTPVEAIAVQADRLTEGVEVDQCDMWASDVCAKAQSCGSGDILDVNGLLHQGAADCYDGVKARCVAGKGLCLDGGCGGGALMLGFECAQQW